MKTILLIVSLFLSTTMTGFGQNYMGMSKTKITKSFGEPDSIGTNCFVYYDANEDGVNMYYFDSNGNCNSFEITRNISYLNQYQVILNNEFTKTYPNRYVKKTKKINYLAELTLSKDTFQIKIQDTNDLTATHAISNDLMVARLQLE